MIIEKRGRFAWLTLADGRQLAVGALRPNIIQVRDGGDLPHSYATVPVAAEDFALTIDETAAGMRLATAAVVVTVDEAGHVDAFYPDGTAMVQDFRGTRTPLVRDTDPQIASAENLDASAVAMQDHSLTDVPGVAPLEIVKTLRPDEHLYGLGDHAGFLDKRGYAWENWNTDEGRPHQEDLARLYKSIPFVIGLTQGRAYGLFVDNTYPTRFDLGKESADYYYIDAAGGKLNYYLFAGPAMTDVAEAYTTLTGTTPLPQKWTLGYQQSRFSYASEKVVRDLAAKMRALNIPCDAIHLDIDYMDGFRVFTADPKRFPQMKGMIADLKQAGIKVVTIIDPGVKVDKQYAIYEDGLVKHVFATNPDGTPYVNTVWPGKAVYPDFGNPAVRTWWGQNQQFLTDLGVAGVWNDMNEPAGFDGPIPDDTVFSDNGQPSTALAMHNVFGQNMAHATYDGLQKLTGKRPFVISRAVYAGAQRYTTVWTGDNRSTWAHLRLALPQLCSLGLSGIPFAGTDIGGFTSDTTAELVTRWLEAALFSPLLRNHSTARSRLQEPWAFGEPTLTIYRKFVELRYHLLDLLYDLFALQPSLPIMRPLVLHYQDDARVQTLNDEYLVGDSLLVAPVVEQGATQRLVYLPAGDWIDFWTGKTIAGAQSIVVDAPLDHLPLFVKAGSLLPWRPLTQSVDVATETTLTFRCYGQAGAYTHYQDDGEDFAYQDGAYNLYEVRFDGDQASVALTRQGYPHPYQTITVETAGQDHVFYYVPEARAYRE